MDRLRLAMLGPPEVLHNGSRLSFALRKAQALLVYLAVEGGMHPRGKLAALLWPDSEPHAARTALRNALALLRSLLAGAAPAAPRHLLSERELVGLNPQATAEHLWQVAELGVQAGVEALEEAVESGLLREETAGMGRPGSYRFAHDLIREVVYNELGEARRQVLHRRALELLYTGGARSSELAYHGLLAGEAAIISMAQQARP